MRFLADTCISPATTSWLRESGHDALHIRDEGLQCLSDGDVLARTRQEDRILHSVPIKTTTAPMANREALNNRPDPCSLTPKQAVQLQQELRHQVRLEDDFGEIRTVAGVDLRIRIGSTEGRCGVVALSFPELEVIEERVHTGKVTFPYVPGLLAFREIPIFIETFELLGCKPDLVFFDGHGYAHPRRFGLACHAGVLLDLPSIGCAKSRLIGEYEDPGVEAGSTSPLMDNGELIGQVLRTKTGVKPVFISPGHRLSFASATSFALQCTRGHRIPEPTRLAHILVSALA